MLLLLLLPAAACCAASSGWQLRWNDCCAHCWPWLDIWQPHLSALLLLLHGYVAWGKPGLACGPLLLLLEQLS